MFLSSYPLDDFWTKIAIEGLVFAGGSFFLATFLNGVMAISFIKLKAAEDSKKSVMSLYNKVPDAVIVLEPL